jgi:hypothetical protein
MRYSLLTILFIAVASSAMAQTAPSGQSVAILQAQLLVQQNKLALDQSQAALTADRDNAAITATQAAIAIAQAAASDSSSR